MSKNASRLATVSSFAVSDKAFARAIAATRAMTKAELVQSLKEAGIITAYGNLTKPYRTLATKRVA